MWYLVSTFWFWLLLALVLGAVVGWRVNPGGRGANWSGLTPWLIVLALGTAIAALRVLPDRAGFWLDLALLMLGVYVIGCLLSVWLKALAGGAEPVAATPAVPTPMMAAPAAAPTLVVPRMDDPPVEPARMAAPAPALDAPEEVITGLSAPRGGKADDLTQIYGVDPDTEVKLNALGLYHFDQMAQLTPGNRRWMFRQLGHSGRFPSWWWRWRYDAEALAAGKPVSRAVASAPPAAMAPQAPAPATEAPQPAPPPREAGFEGTKPQGLAGPRGGKGDDLKRIRGIGKQNEGRLHGLGIWHFDQIAGWSADEVKWVGGFLAFPGRIEREEWLAQARVLASGGVTDFARRADAGEVATSRDDAGDDGQANIAIPGKDFAVKAGKSRAKPRKKPGG